MRRRERGDGRGAGNVEQVDEGRCGAWCGEDEPAERSCAWRRWGQDETAERFVRVKGRCGER